MELLTVKNENMVSIADRIAPITNPEGERPAPDTISVGNAALSATAGATVNPGQISILAGGEGAKNVVFLALIGFLIYKYGKGILNA